MPNNLRAGQICVVTTNDSWIGCKGDICNILVVDDDNTALIEIIKGHSTGTKGWDHTSYIKPITIKYYYGKV